MNFREDGEGGSPNLVKLKDKDSIYGVLRGEIFEFRQHWVGQRSSVCPGEGCPLCAQQAKASFRFRANILVQENKAWVAKILEMGWKVYGQLREINRDNALENSLLKISRVGSGQNDTNYFVNFVKPVPAGEAKILDAIPLLDLQATSAPANGQEKGGPDANEDIPF